MSVLVKITGRMAASVLRVARAAFFLPSWRWLSSVVGLIGYRVFSVMPGSCGDEDAPLPYMKNKDLRH